MKLYYFDSPGRAEPVRIMLKLAGVEFEDVRFKRDEWMSTYKAMSPTGQAPFMELSDGAKLAQSTALFVYAAGKSGFLPSDPLQLARSFEVLSNFDDVRSGLDLLHQYENVYESDPRTHMTS
jgi:prostaglandin-H2 D-isomerase / glutathione transferase